MKLKPKPNLPPPRYQKIQLSGELATTLEAYANYYQVVYGEAIAVEDMLPEMLTAFLKSDRDFVKWLSEQNKAP